jgi:hypothetical protein
MGMKTILPVMLVLVIAASGCTAPVGVPDKEQACLDSGGTVTTAMCCLQTDDFPNLCLIGACGCSPDNSHEVKICDCGEGKCFDGEGCVPEMHGAG